MAKAPMFMPMPLGMTERPSLPGSSLGEIQATFDRVGAGLAPPTGGLSGAPGGGVLYNPSTNEWFVGGNLFSGDDESEAVRSVDYMDNQTAAQPPAGDWQSIDRDSYLSFIDRIRDPSLGRLASRNFGIGVDNLQLLAGYGAQFAGAEEAGKSVVSQQLDDLGKTDVYNRNFTDIGSSEERGVLDWFVANLAQQGPNLVESAVTAALGAAAGGLVGGGPNPVTAAGGALLSLAGKQGFKQGLLAAAKKHAAGEALDAGERKLLLEAAGITGAAWDAARSGAIFGNQTARQFAQSEAKRGAATAFKTAGRAGGAGLATGASNYALGVSDVFGESIEGDAPDRTRAALSGVPYALLETVPEFLLAGRVFGGIGNKRKLADIDGKLAKTGAVLGRGAQGTAIGGTAEGLTEVGQEMLTMAANPLLDFDSPEGVSRLINAFAAGAAVGGPIGGLANLTGRDAPVNLLDPVTPLEGDVLGPETTTTFNPPPPGLPPPSPPRDMLSAPGDVRSTRFTDEQLGTDVAGADALLGAPDPRQITQDSSRILPPYTPPSQDDVPRTFTGEGPVGRPPAPPPTQADVDLGGATLAAQQNPSSPEYRGSPDPIQSGAPADVQQQMRNRSAADLLLTNAQQDVANPQFTGTEQTGTVDTSPRLPNVEQQLPTSQPSPQPVVTPDSAARLPVQQPGATLDTQETGLDTTVVTPQDNVLQDEEISQFPDTAAGRIDQSIETVLSEKPSSDVWSDALVDVVLAAYFPSDVDSNLRKSGATERALAALNEVDQGGREPSSVLGDAVASAVRDTLTPRQIVRNGEVQPWFKYLAAHDLIGTSRGVPYDKLAFPREEVIRRNLGVQVHYNAAQQAAESEAATTKSTSSPETQTSDPLAEVVSAIAAVQQDADELSRLRSRRKAGELYERFVMRGGNTNAMVFDAPVSSYFTKDGTGYSLNIEREDGQDRVKSTEREDDVADMMMAYAGDGKFFRQNGEEVSTSMGSGDVLMRAKALLRKFAIKPKFHVFRNVEDLKAKNSDLFKRANSARKQGDFATTKAMGYAFGDTVILFSDYIHSEKQLAFVLAHEVVGHIGLRGVMKPKQLNKMMSDIYNSDERLRGVIDQYMNIRGIGKAEAVEEWLADNAARLEISVLARVWSKVKNALNRIGLKFEDDAARPIIAQMRRYARTGNGSYVDARTLIDNMQMLAAEEHEGRFQTAPIDEGGLASRAATVRGMTWYMGNQASTGLAGIRDFVENNDTKRFLRGNKMTLNDMFNGALQQIQTLDYKATKNTGLSELFQLFTRQGQVVRTLLNEYNQLTSFTHSVNWGIMGRDAPSNQDQQEAGAALAAAALHRAQLTEDATLDQYDNIFDQDGNLNQTALDVLVDSSEVTREQLAEGLQWNDPTTGQPTRMEPVVVSDKAWRIFEEQRAAINKAAVDLLHSKYVAADNHAKEKLRRLAGLRGRDNASITQEILTDINRIADKYDTMYRAGFSLDGSSIVVDNDVVDEANTFLMEATRAFHEQEKLTDWITNNPQEAASAFTGPDFQAIRDSLQRIFDAGISEADVRRIQRIIQDQVVARTETLNGERLAKRTILSSYVPFKREGNYQARQVAYDAETGEVVELDNNFASATFYGRYGSRKEAMDEALELDKHWNEYDGDTRIRGNTFTVKDSRGDERTIKFGFETGDARQTQDRATLITYGELLNMLERLQINLSPEARERLVTATTRQGATARAGLMRAANPGWSQDMVRSVSQHLETNAHVSAKNVFRSLVDNLVDDSPQANSKWFGSREELNRLKREAERAEGTSQARAAQLAYEKYAYQFKESHRPVTGRDNTIEINGKKHELKGRGEGYREIGRSLIRWYSEDTNIIDATEDILNTTVGAKLKQLTVMSHLGMSVATAMINVASLATHTSSYLAFHNPNNGFGGGFGMAKTSKEIFRATNNLYSFKMADAAFLKNMIDNNEFSNYGLQRDEAEFLYEETLAGNLAPALSDALLGSARGRNSSRMSDFTRKWMTTFNYTEQLNRRATVMTAYRLERDRNIAEGMPADEARSAAKQAAEVALRTTQGEYSMFNRPEIFRGSVMQYIFMYKMFTLISVNLVAKMPYKGKITFLAMLFLASGVKGLPFADDIMDLIDTIAQIFGIPMTGIERAAYRIINDIAPGTAPWVMRGGLDQVTGGTMSTRLGMGDLVPLTGALKHGADPWREASDFAGPVFSVGAGIAEWTGLAAKYGGEVLGLKEDTTNLNDLIRNNPASFIRAIGDTVAYADDGAITNSRGQVISKNLTAMTYLARILGFYPSEATKQHDAIRTSKFATEYAKAIKSDFVSAYVKAAISKDRKRMNQLTKDVADWNRYAKGSGLEISKFMRSAQRAVREARRPATERYLRTVPKALRPDTLQVMTLYGYDREDFD